MNKDSILKEVTMMPFISKLNSRLLSLSTNERRLSAEAYMRNQFPFIGVDTTTRRKVFKAILEEAGKPLFEDLDKTINYLFTLERELQYCAVELFALYKKEWDSDSIAIIEKCIVTKSWWDTVDYIASDLAGPYFKLFPKQIIPVTERWNKSGNFWLQRSSLLFQKKYREQTNKDLLAKYILHCAHSNEFFIQKAIGWCLREFAKTDPAWVKKFVQQNALKPLSVREALKHF
ncbi:MAG: DNA alkylation repair protein [Bacteroidota bacterium]